MNNNEFDTFSKHFIAEFGRPPTNRETFDAANKVNDMLAGVTHGMVIRGRGIHNDINVFADKGNVEALSGYLENTNALLGDASEHLEKTEAAMKKAVAELTELKARPAPKFVPFGGDKMTLTHTKPDGSDETITMYGDPVDVQAMEVKLNQLAAAEARLKTIDEAMKELPIYVRQPQNANEAKVLLAVGLAVANLLNEQIDSVFGSDLKGKEAAQKEAEALTGAMIGRMRAL